MAKAYVLLMDNQHLSRKEVCMKKIELQEFVQRISERFPEESFEVLEYTTYGASAKIKCKNCGHIFEITKACNFLASSKKQGCKFCQSKNYKAREAILLALQEEYDILDISVKETHKYYKIQCKKCGHIRETTINNYKKNFLCGCSTGVYRARNGDFFIQEVNKNNKGDGSYELVGEYKNQTSPVLIKHSCGFIWKVRPNDIVHGQTYCPRCSRTKSKGERLVSKILQELDVVFEEEKRLENSRQRFDFYLPRYHAAIEYNGAQHYIENNRFCVSLEQQQARDNKKRKYCLDNNILLLEIPYYWKEEQIQKEIVQFIDKFNDYLARE